MTIASDTGTAMKQAVEELLELGEVNAVLIAHGLAAMEDKNPDAALARRVLVQLLINQTGSARALGHMRHKEMPQARGAAENAAKQAREWLMRVTGKG
jgi:hypothetical protein